jgi:hypothetical protein
MSPVDLDQAATVTENGSGTQPAAALRFRPAVEVLSDRPPVTIVGGVVWAGAVTTLVAEAGAGKTFVALDLGAAVADARPWHGRAVREGSVAYCSWEGDALALRLLGLREAGATLAHLHLLRASAPLSPSVDRDGLERPSAGELALAEALAELTARLAAAGAPPVRLLVVDTLRASLTGSEDHSEDVAGYLRAVRRLLAPYPEAGALVVHHAGWQDGETRRKRERGSSALRGNIDATLYVEITEEALEQGRAYLTLSALKIRDDTKPAPLRLVRSRVTVDRVDETGRPYTTCVIETDPRSREDLEAERARAETAEAEALAQKAEAVIARGTVTSLETLRALLGVSKPAAQATLARLLLAGRVHPPARQRGAYTLAGGSESDRVGPSRTESDPDRPATSRTDRPPYRGGPTRVRRRSQSRPPSRTEEPAP